MLPKSIKMVPKMVPKGSQGLPWSPLGTDPGSGPVFCLILAPIWAPFWLPFGPHWVPDFHHFSQGPPKPFPSSPWTDLGSFLEPIWLHFGSLFRDPVQRRRSEILLLFTTLQAHWASPGDSKKSLFSRPVLTSPPEPPQVYLFT